MVVLPHVASQRTPAMDGNAHWYAASVASIFALLVIRRIGHYVAPCVPGIRYWALRATRPLFFIEGRHRPTVTYVEAASLSIYVSANAVLMFADKPQTRDLMLRSGLMSTVNMTPLFLGGRTSALADRLGIPLHTYYLAHYWVGGVAIAQALLHAVLALFVRKAALDRITISGALVGIPRLGGIGLMRSRSRFAWLLHQYPTLSAESLFYFQGCIRFLHYVRLEGRSGIWCPASS